MVELPLCNSNEKLSRFFLHIFLLFGLFVMMSRVMCAIVTQKTEKNACWYHALFLFRASDKTWYSFLAEIAQYQVSTYLLYMPSSRQRDESPFFATWAIWHSTSHHTTFYLHHLFFCSLIVIVWKTKVMLRKSLLFFERERDAFWCSDVVAVTCRVEPICTCFYFPLISCHCCRFVL